MTLRQIRVGSCDNIHQYDDADFSSAVETDQPIKAGTPVDPNDVLRLDDIGSIVGDVKGPAASTDANLVEFDGISGKKLKDGGLSHTDTADAISKKHAHADVTQDISVVTDIGPPQVMIVLHFTNGLLTSVT